MTPLPASTDPQVPLIAWRIDKQAHGDEWDSGVGAKLFGGRWNPKGMRVVYCSLDQATCILESAVHKGFDVLDAQPHILTRMRVVDPGAVKVIGPSDVANPAWLHGGMPSAAQQE